MKKEILAKIAALRSQATAIAAGVKAEGKDMTADQLAAVTALLDQVDAAKAQIESHDKKEQLDARLAQLDAEAKEVPASRTVVQPAAVVTKVAERSDLDPNRGFQTPREFFAAVMKAGKTGAIDNRLKPLAAVGSDENQGGQDSLGGFLIPQGFSPNLLSVAAESDPTAGRTMAIPMGSPIVNIPARTDKVHTSSVTGGMRFYRRSETDAGTSSTIAVEQVSLRANSLMGLNYSTEELLTDSPISVAALLAAGFKDEYAATILNEKLFGTGAGQFMGVMNAPCLVSQAKETGQAASTVVTANVLKMRSRCWGYADAIWIANHDTYPQLAQLSLAVGTAGTALYQTSIVEDRPDMLLGRPIFYSEFAATLGTTGDLILGNWSQYLEGTLQGMDVQESIHVRFVNNERAFRATVRNDGQPWWRSALTPKKSSVTLSPFVCLSTRA